MLLPAEVERLLVIVAHPDDVDFGFSEKIVSKALLVNDSMRFGRSEPQRRTRLR